MNKPLLLFVIDPVLAIGGSIGALFRVGFYEFVSQVTPNTEAFTNVTSTGILAVMVWFLLTRIQKSIDDMSAATKDNTAATREIVEEMRKK